MNTTALRASLQDTLDDTCLGTVAVAVAVAPPLGLVERERVARKVGHWPWRMRREG